VVHFIIVEGMKGDGVNTSDFKIMHCQTAFLHLETRVKKNSEQSDFLSEPPTMDDLDPQYNNPFQERVVNQRIAFPCPVKGMYQYYLFQ